MMEWLFNNYFFSRDNKDLVVPKKIGGFWYVFQLPISEIEKLFGDIVLSALDNGADPRQAIRDCDPNNTLGYNDLI